MNRRRHFVRTCKKHGLHVQPAALQSMMQQVNDEEFLLQALKWLNHALASKSPKIVTPGLWEEAAEACSDVSPVEKNANRSAKVKRGSDELVEITTAFDTPKLIYDSLRQQFYYSDRGRPPLLGNAKDKIEMMTQRYAFIHQRVVRNFSTPLTCIDRLLGMSNSISQSKSQVLLGMLHRHPEGLELEDLTGTIVLKGLEKAKLPNSAFYTEGSIVLVKGHYDNGLFWVEQLGFPPLESRAESLPFLPPRERVSKLNSRRPLTVYSMANVELDNDAKVQELQTVIDQLIAEPNKALLVLLGNFTTESLALSTALDELAGLLEDLPRHHTVLVVPGPNDTPSACWPIPPMTSHSLSQLDQVRLVSNPCQLTYGNQQITIVRKDFVRDHLQSQVLTVSGGEHNLATRAVNTILGQGHLMPQAPIYWNYDHALHLYPLPDLLLMGLDEGEDRLECSKAQCHVVSPGQYWAKVTLMERGKAQVRYSQDDVEVSDEE